MPAAYSLSAHGSADVSTDDRRHKDNSHKESWSIGELNRLLGVAARLPDGELHPATAIDNMLARHWWPAFLLLMMDAEQGHSAVLAADHTAYDRAAGRFICGPLVFALHPFTISALNRLPATDIAPRRLLPWRLDPAVDSKKRVTHMLFRAYRTLLYRAGLPHVTDNLFSRLRVTAARHHGLLDHLAFDSTFRPREGKPSFPRAKDRRRRAIELPADTAHLKATRRRNQWRELLPDVRILTNDSPRSLHRFLEERYLPVHPMKPGPKSEYRSVVRRLGWFAGHDVIVDELSDDLIERFMVWRRGQVQAITVNGDRATLLALWREAWRKKLIDMLPRDIRKLKVPKRLPVAWTTEEVSRLLTAAAQEPGLVGVIPARLFWPALMLLVYDSGLRIGAIRQLHALDLDAGGFVSARAETQKQLTEQAFSLHADTLAALAMLPAEREMLLPIPWTDKAPINRRLRRILGRAGLPSTSRDLFHKLRRTHGTRVCDRFGDEVARRQLGHSTVALTRASYIDPRQLHRQTNVAESIERPAWNPPDQDLVS